MTKAKDFKAVVATVPGENPRVLLPPATQFFEKTPPATAADVRKMMTLEEFPSDIDSGFRWAPWGSSDNRPTKVRCKLRQVPMAGAALDRLVKMMYGNGLTYVRNEDFQPGRVDYPKHSDLRVDAFLQKNRVALAWYIAQCWDYRMHAITFSEMVMNAEQTEITHIFHKTAEFCRFSRQDERDLKIKYIGYAPRFTEGSTNDDFITWIPLFRWYEEERFFEQLRGRRFAWASMLHTPGTFYYPEQPWFGLFLEDGWLDVSFNVPRIVTAMQKNQITLKYLITISREYFRLRDSDWDIYTAEQQEEKFKTKAAEIEKYLAGTDNVLKSLTTMVDEDPVTGAHRGTIKIEAIDDKTKVGTWVPDSNAADAQIVQGLGLHPSQVGLSPEGGKMGAGSGSDQRESYNTTIGLNTLEQDIVLEPLNFIARFNGWDVRFVIDHTSHVTQNVSKTGIAEPAAPQPQMI